MMLHSGARPAPAPLLQRATPQSAAEAAAEASDGAAAWARLAAEHRESADSRDWFTEPCYGLQTSALIEWHFVCEPERGPVAAGVNAWPLATNLT